VVLVGLVVIDGPTQRYTVKLLVTRRQ